MNSPSPMRYPDRLLQGEDVYAELIREALNDPSSEQPSFESLDLKRRRRQLRKRATAGGSLIAALTFLGWQISSEEPAAISPESPVAQLTPLGRDDTEDRRQRHRDFPSHQPALEKKLAGGVRPDDSPESSAALSGDKGAARTAAPPHPTRSLEPSAKAPFGATLQAEEPADRDCATLTTLGLYAEAHSCYARKTQGSGIDAEVAWLEQARLRARVQGDIATARRTLATYLQRFPNGNLRPEAEQMLRTWERSPDGIEPQDPAP